VIIGIGIDTVDIDRFKHWHCYKEKALLRIFCREEINYCLAEPRLFAQRFAARFAAKEALIKAASPLIKIDYTPFSLSNWCKQVHIHKETDGKPIMKVNWTQLGHREPEALKIHLSLSHTHYCASAVVILEQLS
jgi:holo-[acyl-carrier protein] synthase